MRSAEEKAQLEDNEDVGFSVLMLQPKRLDMRCRCRTLPLLLGPIRIRGIIYAWCPMWQ